MNGSLQTEDKLKAMLKDLGKATLRGVQRCYKCGTVNGIRGTSCKNKACDVVFTEAGLKKKHSVVCKLHTDSSPQVFSVRVRDKGPDFRGFVQLPALQSNIEEGETSFLSPSTALCFVESCQGLFHNNILKCHDKNSLYHPTSCQHIQSAMRCCSDATVLRIDCKILESFNISQYMKATIWQESRETSGGSIVQRVSKSIMAVKCKVSTKHPLGFLHIAFSSPPKCKEKETYYVCTCSSYKSNMKSGDPSRHCIHYYACVAAFASDLKLTFEFSPYVIKEKGLDTYTIEIDNNDDGSRLVEILNNAINQSSSDGLSKDVDNNFLPELTSDMEGLTSIVDVSNEVLIGLDEHSLSPVIQQPPQNTKPTKPKKKAHVSQCNILKKEIVKKKIIHHDLPFTEDVSDPDEVNLPFIHWLSSVTERMNQTMHIQFNGKLGPQSLIFHIPHTFFDCLMSRLITFTRTGCKKKQLPKSVSSYVRSTTPPFGKFYKYTWQIANLAHVKAVFNTPLVSLNETRSFVQKADGTFEDLDPQTLVEGLLSREGKRPIRPLEIKSFLKIGTISTEDSPSVLYIHWTPNLLPISKTGELQIVFECGLLQVKPSDQDFKPKKKRSKCDSNLLTNTM